ncbi:SH3 domain-containing protein [Chryseobacterium jejuense]|uniref:Bacterial SH3 domain n=1 Tax=Chryseobacterium jejuense TaxID=445960 RepID=A0A2X2XLB3_CHRJE|nr:SH3 domain-containing protein [Chryseobacterium jejuense]SDI70789.1 SH3 domain-containing protein [Chryseobacterium jejuense]SQB26569.1 Bacterial SH3 domain [Chryseobacterium jejuense]
MKKTLSIIILLFSLFLLNSCFKANDNIGHGGRCTGSAYCTACLNCSGCGHCNSGGTCGVCGGGSKKTSSSNSSNPKNTFKRHKSGDSYKPSKIDPGKPPKVFIDKVNINVNSSTRSIAGIAITNIYERPSLKSKVIAVVPKDTKLIKLSTEGSWYKVQVKSSGKKGYVFNKDVK